MNNKPTVLETKPCVTCGKPYEQHRHWQKFCSRECKDKFFIEERRLALDKYRSGNNEGANEGV